MPDYSFYTDMRCVFLASLGQVAGARGENFTGKDYFDWLDLQLESSDRDGCALIWKMLPPRWNIWQYLFGHDYLDDEALYPYLKFMVNILGGGLNMDTVCSINRYLWVGNQFNFDRAFRGDQKVLPKVVVLPDGYPVPK